ncbi:hypothetical protein AALP_AA3G271500 [Arabis alpina]|uniref:Uncharacterized protein n=1 Tax=Arabis alpina TaxID=50452 RepID=A0A087HBZ8_ARAAL|nr:hypothetical protein AALP_AA3G271500 [Arabis alpina]
MEHPRSFRSLARRATGSGKPPTLTTVTTYAAPTVAPAPAEPTTAPPSAMPTTAPTSTGPATAPASAKPTTVSASAEPTTVPPTEPRDTSARKTTTAAKGSRLPSSTRTEIVAALPALPAPLPSDYDAKKAAKGKGHAGDDCKRSSNKDDVTDVDREPKRARARSASPPRRVSSSVFQNKASATSHFSTLVFHDEPVAPINTKSSGDMMRQGLKFLALVNKVGHELEDEIEDLKRTLEDETHRSESMPMRFFESSAPRHGQRSAMALAAAVEREQCSAAILMKRDGELATVVEKLRKADGHIQSLERKLTRAKNKFDEHQGDPRSNMVYQVQRVANLDVVRLLLGLVDEQAEDEERFERLMTSLHGLLHVLDPKVKAPTVVAHDRTLETYAASVGVADPSRSLLGGAGSCKAAVEGVDGKFYLIGGVGAEVTKGRIDDVTEGAGTVGAPEEMRTDEDS